MFKMLTSDRFYFLDIPVEYRISSAVVAMEIGCVAIVDVGLIQRCVKLYICWIIRTISQAKWCDKVHIKYRCFFFFGTPQTLFLVEFLATQITIPKSDTLYTHMYLYYIPILETHKL